MPQPILPGGVVVTLFPANSPMLKAARVAEAEVYNMMRGVPGRIQSIVNIHNPSIEFHPADPGINTGAVVILVAGGGHNTLNVGTEGADFVSFFYNYGVNTVILRNRLRRDGYVAETDAVYDALQGIKMVRARAREWNLDPLKIGIVGFSAGAELAAPAALIYETFDTTHNVPANPLAAVSSRPDFVGLVYPGPTPFARNADDAGTCERSADVHHLGRNRGCPACDLGGRVLRRDVACANSKPRDAHLRQWRARERIEGSEWRAVWHLASPVRRLVPRPGFPREARHRDESRTGRRRARGRAATRRVAPADPAVQVASHEGRAG